MPQMDSMWFLNKKANKNAALLMLLFIGAGDMGVYDAFGIDVLGWYSVIFRVVTFIMLVWIGVGLFKRKLAAI